MQEAFLEIYHTIPHHACSVDGMLKLHELLNYLQDAAAQHADILHFGMQTISEQNMLWVLSRLKIEIVKPVTLGMPIRLETYPTQGVKAFAVRQYGLFDANNELCVKASSFWLLLNRANFRPLKPSDHLPYPPANPVRPVFFQMLDKIEARPVSFPQTSRVASFADIDLNDHINNAVYARFVEDEIAKQIHSAPQFKSFQINFNRALRAEESFETAIVPLENNIFYVEGTTGEPRQSVFQAFAELA